MKHILIVLIVSLISFSGFANSPDSANSFKQGKTILSLGWGLQSMDQTFYSQRFENDYGRFTKQGFGPIHFRAEYALSNKIGIGTSLNYCMYGGQYVRGESYTNNISVLTGLLRFNYHFATTWQLDPFFSVGAGFIIANCKYTYSGSNSGSYYGYGSSYDYTNEAKRGTVGIPVAFEAVAGLRFYLSPRVSLYSEMGIAKSIIQLGMSVSL